MAAIRLLILEAMVLRKKFNIWMNINTDRFKYSTRNGGKYLQHHDDETMDF